MIQRTVDILCRTSNPTNHTAKENQAWWVERGRQTREVRFQFRGIGKWDASFRTVTISPIEKLIRLSLATMLFLSECAAEHMLAPFSQVSNAS